jgi:formylglycine-generating enzyme required for sulfatase activity
MIELPGGSFLMGTQDEEGFRADGEGPIRRIELSPFQIEPTTVTNGQFAAFVKATGYRTDAERFGFSFVFEGFLSADTKRVAPVVDATPWWRAVSDSFWKQPEGPGSSITSAVTRGTCAISGRANSPRSIPARMVTSVPPR